MTIASSHKEMKEIIDKHSVYGAEALINSLVYASRDNKYLTEDEMHKLVSYAFKMRERRC